MTESVTPASLDRRLGVFARVFTGGGTDVALADVHGAGFRVAHWNCSVMGRSTLGEDVTGDDLARVRATADGLGVRIPSLSATYNVAHPDPARRAAWTVAATRLIGLAPALGVELVTLCSGTRDPDDQWRHHADNAAPDAWRDLRATLDRLLDAAHDAGVHLGIEPEPGNIVRDATTAARLLDELGADAPVGIVFDAANLVAETEADDRHAVLRDAVELLGSRVESVHLKGLGGSHLSLADHAAVLDALPDVPVLLQDPAADDAAARRIAVLEAAGRIASD